MSFSSVQYKPSTAKRLKLLFQQFGQCLLSVSSRYITEMVTAEDGQNFQSPGKIFRILFFHFYIILLVLRFITAAAVLNYQLFPGYFFYDPMLDLFRQLGILDRHLALVLWPAPLLIIYYDYLINFTRCLRSYYLAYDLIVTNRKDFTALNPDVSLWKTSFNLLLLKKDLEKLKLTQWRKQLPNIGHLDADIRFKAVALATVHDFLLAFTMVSLGLLCPLVLYLLSLTSVWVSFSFLAKSITLFNGTVALYLLWLHVKQALFFILYFHLIILVLVSQQNAHNQRIKRRLHLMSFQKNYSHQKRQLTAALAFYIRFHFQLVQDIITSDRQFVSKLLFFLLISMFGLNVFAMVALLSVHETKSLSFFEKSFLLAIVLLQSVLTGVGLKPMIDAHRALHSPARLLYRVVGILGSSSRSPAAHLYLHLKLKLSTYYEVLTCGEPFAFSVFSIGKVTSNALLQVRFRR